MKLFKLAVWYYVFLLWGCGKFSGEVDYAEIDFRGNPSLAYLKDQETPFSGRAIEYFLDGQKKAEVNYKNGKSHGEYIHWYQNGKVERKGNFKDGKFDGEWIRYNEDGLERSRTTYKKNKAIRTIFNE